MIILTDFHSEWRKTPKLVNFQVFLLIWKWPKLLNSVPFINKTLVNHVYIRIWSFWLTFTVLQWMKSNSKISQFSSFLLKLLNSVPFINKTLVNHVYIRIWSFWLTFTVLQWMKAISKISQFSSFLLRSGYAIWVKIWKWLKLLNSVPFIKKKLVNQVYIRIWSFWLTFSSFLLKLLNSVPFINKTLVNHVYIRIWSFWLTFTVLQWMKTNFKISQFSRFLLMSEYSIQVKISNWLKPLNSVPFIKKTLGNQAYIWIWSFWLTFTVNEGKLQN